MTAVEARRAWTSGGMSVVTESGTTKNVPAGVCWTFPRLREGGTRIAWTEHGTQHDATMSDEQLRAYLRGCMLQY